MPDANGSQVSALSGLASIIVTCCGMLGYTKLLVPSLQWDLADPLFLDLHAKSGENRPEPVQQR